ncbi:MAG: type II secretion system F family protein [Hyphomicrobiales bacterium]|nr:type II secretion system F family protein [Hyphomicrobiales bacterium]
MSDFIEAIIKPEVLMTIFAALAVFAMIFTIAMPMLQRDRLPARMRVMATERDKMRSARLAELSKKDGKGSLRQTPQGFMLEIVEKLNLRSAFDTEEQRDKLKMAGLRGQAPLVTYMFFRLVMPIIVTIGALIYMFLIASYDYPPIVNVAASLLAGYVGYYLPNMFITNQIQRRQQSIMSGFPDSLDMLLICVQSGMSIEAAFGKVAQEVGAQSIELAEEYSLTTAELSYLPERRQAFENLGRRTGVPGIKAVATALIQAERYGTPVGQALRVMAKENREMRMSEAEKKAAALPPKLTVPMIVFFLPVLFVVIIGPALIQVFGWE